MEQQKVKEMFAVVFTFLVMGIIGFSVYKPEQNISDTLANTENLSSVQTAAALEVADQNVQGQALSSHNALHSVSQPVADSGVISNHTK